MDTYRDHRVRSDTRPEPDPVESDYLRPEINLNQSNQSSNRNFAIIIAAVVVIVGAYLLYANEWSTTTSVPKVTQNSTILPAPDATPAPPTVPAAPAVSDTAAPPVTDLAPKPPVAPAQ